MELQLCFKLHFYTKKSTQKRNWSSRNVCGRLMNCLPGCYLSTCVGTDTSVRISTSSGSNSTIGAGSASEMSWSRNRQTVKILLRTNSGADFRPVLLIALGTSHIIRINQSSLTGYPLQCLLGLLLGKSHYGTEKWKDKDGQFHLEVCRRCQAILILWMSRFVFDEWRLPSARSSVYMVKCNFFNYVKNMSQINQCTKCIPVFPMSCKFFPDRHVRCQPINQCNKVWT